MRIAIFSATPARLARIFVERRGPELGRHGIEIGLVVEDCNASKSEAFLRHALTIARRQARLAGCTTATAALRRAYYKWLTEREKEPAPPDYLASIRVQQVPTLNNDASARMVREAACDVVCLMGTRILTTRSLERLGVPVINIHSSDPAFVRGGPAVVWEVLADRSAIDLTVHRAVAELDAGGIIARTQHPIHFGPGLGATVSETLLRAEAPIADLFVAALETLQADPDCGTPFTPGPLRVTPSLREAHRADCICRRKSRQPIPTSGPVQGSGTKPELGKTC